MENTKVVYLRGKEVCIFCGNILKEKVEYDEHIKYSIYACNCKEAQEHLRLKKAVKLAQEKLKSFEYKNEISSIEKEKVELIILKEKFEKS